MLTTRIALVLFVLGIDLVAGSHDSLTSLLKKASQSNRPVVLVVENDANSDTSASINSAEAKPAVALNLPKIRHQHHSNQQKSRYESSKINNGQQLNQKKRYRPLSNRYVGKEYKYENQYNREQRFYEHNQEKRSHSRHREHHRDDDDSYHPQSQKYRSRDRRDRESRNSRTQKRVQNARDSYEREERSRDHYERHHKLDREREYRPYNSEKYHQEKRDRHINKNYHHNHHYHQEDHSLSSEESSKERPLSKQERRERRRERQRQLALELKEYDRINGGDLKYGLRTGKVVQNLLRISNDIMCDAKDDCKDECDESAKEDQCKDTCEEKFDECEESPKTQADECQNNTDGLCDDSQEKNPSTRGILWEEETEKCKRC